MKQDKLSLFSSFSSSKTEEGVLLFSKKKDEGRGLYYCLFMDMRRTAKEENDYVSKKKTEYRFAWILEQAANTCA